MNTIRTATTSVLLFTSVILLPFTAFSQLTISGSMVREARDRQSPANATQPASTSRPWSGVHSTNTTEGDYYSISRRSGPVVRGDYQTNQAPSNEVRLEQMALLERELGIRKEADGAFINIKAPKLYTSGSSQISSTAHLSMRKLAAYVQLSNSNSVKISHFYNPKDETVEMAQARSMQALTFLTSQTYTRAIRFSAVQPLPIKDAMVAAGTQVDPSVKYDSVVRVSISQPQ